MKLALRHYTLLLVLVVGVPPAADAVNWGKLFSKSDDVTHELSAAGRSARSAGNVDAHSSSFLLHELGYVTDDALKGATKAEIKELEDATIRFSSARQGSHLLDDLAHLKQARAALEQDGEALRTIQYSDNLESIRVKVPSTTTVFDDSLRLLAQARMQHMLDTPFDVDDIRVIPLALADDARISTRESAQYIRRLPRNMSDNVGPLARIHELGATREEMVNALKPYQNMTVVLVGHIPHGTGEFFVHTAKGPIAVPIAKWSEAAKEAGVNLIPIGCNSGRFADFGTHGLVNSASVLDRLLQIHAWKPRTVGIFLKQLTGDDFVLLVNATDVHLFTNAAQIISRENKKLVGQIAFDAMRVVGRTTATSRSTINGAPTYAGCFTEQSGEAFDTCAERTSHAITQFKAQQEELDRAKAQAERLAALPEEVANAQNKHQRALQSAVGTAFIYVLVWLAAAFLIPHGLLAHHVMKVIEGASWRTIFDAGLVRYSIRNTLQEIYQFIPTLLSGIKLHFSEPSDRGMTQVMGLLAVLPAIAGLPLLYLLLDNEWWIWLIIPAVWIGAVMAWMMWYALVERSAAMAMSSIMFFAWIAAAYMLYGSYDDLNTSKNLLESLNQEYSSLRADSGPTLLQSKKVSLQVR